MAERATRYSFGHAMQAQRHQHNNTTQEARRRYIEAALSAWRPQLLCFQHSSADAVAATDAAPQALDVLQAHAPSNPHPGLHASGHGQGQQLEWIAACHSGWQARNFGGHPPPSAAPANGVIISAGLFKHACRAHLRCGGVASGQLPFVFFVSILLTWLCSWPARAACLRLCGHTPPSQPQQRRIRFARNPSGKAKHSRCPLKPSSEDLQSFIRLCTCNPLVLAVG